MTTTMMGGLLISLYLFTLASFLGLDLIRKVPPTLYGALATGMGAVAAVGLALAVVAAGTSRSGATAQLSTLSVAAGAAGVVGGLLRMRRMLRGRGSKR